MSDPQFGLVLDEVTAVELYALLSREYISPTVYPHVSELVRKLRELVAVRDNERTM